MCRNLLECRPSLYGIGCEWMNLLEAKEKADSQRIGSCLAGAEGLEPSTKVLEDDISNVKMTNGSREKIGSINVGKKQDCAKHGNTIKR